MDRVERTLMALRLVGLTSQFVFGINSNFWKATSTGGITMKMAGRVGDSPLIGSGAYADGAMGGCSTTGHGESIMKVLLAFRTAQALERQVEDRRRHRAGQRSEQGEQSNGSVGSDAEQPGEACQAELDRMFAKVGGCGGVVCVDAEGNPGLGHTTPKMPWAVCQRAEEGKGVDVDGSGGSGGSDSPAPWRRRLRSGMDSSEAPPDLCVKK